MQPEFQLAFSFKNIVVVMSALVCMLAIGALAQDNGVPEYNKGETAIRMQKDSVAWIDFKLSVNKGNAAALVYILKFHPKSLVANYLPRCISCKTNL